MTFPCPGDSGGTKCVLEQDGTTIRPLDGGEKMSISQLAGMKPSGKTAQKALSAALKKQKKLVKAAKKIDPDFNSDFNPVSNLNDSSTASLPFMTNMASGEKSLTGNTPSPPATVIPYTEEEEKADTSAQNNFPFVGGVAEEAGEEDYGGYEEDLEEVIEEEEEDIEAEVQKLLDKFAGKKNKKTDVATKKPLSFGKNEKISQSGRNFFTVIMERYQSYRKRGEFVKKSPQKRNPDKQKNRSK